MQLVFNLKKSGSATFFDQISSKTLNAIEAKFSRENFEWQFCHSNNLKIFLSASYLIFSG